MQATVKQRLIEFCKATKTRPSHLEAKCGFSHGYINSLKDCPSSEKINVILSNYPQLSRVWLLAGEGPMLNDGTTITQSNVNGPNNANVNEGDALKAAINEIGEQRKLTSKAHEQIDRLLAIIEKLTVVAVVLIAAACSSDPMKGKLAATINDPSYRYLSHQTTGVVTYGEMAERLVERYWPVDFMSRDDFEKERNELQRAVASREKDDAAFGLDSYEYYVEDPRLTVMLMDSLLSVYDSLGFFSWDYQHAVKKYEYTLMIVWGLDPSDDLRLSILMESDFGREDFAVANTLMKDPDKQCVTVSHRFRTRNGSHEALDVLGMDGGLLYARTLK